MQTERTSIDYLRKKNHFINCKLQVSFIKQIYIKRKKNGRSQKACAIALRIRLPKIFYYDLLDIFAQNCFAKCYRCHTKLALSIIMMF